MREVFPRPQRVRGRKEEACNFDSNRVKKMRRQRSSLFWPPLRATRLLSAQRYLALQFVDEILQEDHPPRLFLRRTPAVGKGGDALSVRRNIILRSQRPAKRERDTLSRPYPRP